MRTVEEIVAMFTARRNAYGPVLERMREVREMTRGELIVPLNELDRSARASVANLATQGIDQMAMRVASTLPAPYFPPLKDGVEQSAKMARLRKRAMESMWDHNRFDLKMRRRARLLLAYGTSPVVLKPDFKRNLPVWQVRNPLDTYPAMTEDADDIVPENVIFSYTKDAAWLLKNYGPQVANLNMGKVTRDSRYRILEYVCANELVLVAMGAEDGTNSESGWAEAVEIERIPNRTGMPLAVVPKRITLDEVRGQFDNMVGMFYTRARLQALTEIAIERGIFPDEYLIARPGENPEIIQTADGKMGQLGVVKGGDIQQLQTNPGYKTDVAMDRIERQERLEGGIPAEFGGESASNIRTGRRGETVLAATVDFKVQEAQKIFEASIFEEDRIAIAIEKSYWGEQPKSFFIAGKQTNAKVDYVPSKIWETDFHYVTYPSSGSDVNALIVGLGQRLGTGLMSKESAREADPLITDPELEHDRIVAEGVEAALLSSLQSQAADPNGPYQPADLAYIARMVGTDKMNLAEAIEAAQKRAQERQAAQAPAGSPETMPGLAMPGMGAEQPAGPPAGPPALGDLIARLRGGQQAGAAAPPGTPGSVLSLAGRLG
jgi:hypothetical protein